MRDRPLWLIAGIYLCASWVVFRVVGWLRQHLDVPSTVVPWTLVFLCLGLAVVMLTAILQKRVAEGGGEAPSGLKRFFTWRNTAIGAVTAFGALALATVLAMALRVSLG